MAIVSLLVRGLCRPDSGGLNSTRGGLHTAVIPVFCPEHRLTICEQVVETGFQVKMVRVAARLLQRVGVVVATLGS